MIGIIVALKTEADPLLKDIENLSTFNLAGKPCYQGKLYNKDVALIICGIGKVSASLSTQAIIDKFNPEYILNFGTCGGNNNNVEIGQYYLVDKAFQFDFDIREIDKVPLGYIQEYNTVFFNTTITNNISLKKASLATADRFSKSKIDMRNILINNCPIRDMEGCSIVQVCHSNNKPVYLIKGVTDIYGSGNNGKQFYDNLLNVCNNFPQIIKEFINNI